MPPSHNRPLSPLATKGPAPQNVFSLNNHPGQRVARMEYEPWVTTAQRAPGMGDGLAFVFGNTQGTSVFSFA